MRFQAGVVLCRYSPWNQFGNRSDSASRALQADTRAAQVRGNLPRISATGTPADNHVLVLMLGEKLPEFIDADYHVSFSKSLCAAIETRSSP